MAQPLLEHIAHAAGSGRCAVLADGVIADVFEAMPQRPQILRFQESHGRLQWRKRQAIARHVRGLGFSHALILPHSLKSSLIPWLAGIPHRIGHVGEHRFGLVNRRPLGRAGKAREQNMVSYYLALTSAITPSRDAAPPQAPRLSVDASQIAAQQAHFGLGDYWVFAPGAEFGPAKQWPLEHWQALLGLIPSAQRLAILGGPRDHAFGEALAQSAKPGQRVANLCGQTTMAQAIALIAGARLLVSNDSGLMHVAAALAKPQIAVFGSTDPMHSGPINPQAIVRWLKLDCSPCFQRHCPLTHHDCLRNISPEVLARDLRCISAKTTMLAP